MSITGHSGGGQGVGANLAESTWLAVAGRVSMLIVATMIVPVTIALFWRSIDTGTEVAVQGRTLAVQEKTIDRLTDAQLDLTTAQSALAQAQAVLTENQSDLSDTLATDRLSTKEQIAKNASDIDQLERRINRLQQQIAPIRAPYDSE